MTNATSDSGCKAWCGKNTHPAGGGSGEGFAYWDPDLGVCDEAREKKVTTYCSSVCRDRAIAPKAPEGAPAGYVECSRKCGRWTVDTGTLAGKVCYTCLGYAAPDLRRQDWTPAVPPAPHPERRHKYANNPFRWTALCGYESAAANEADQEAGRTYHEKHCTKCKAITAPDAKSPEPSKACACPHGPYTTDGKCPIHVTAGIVSQGLADCACAKCKPEPAKAKCESNGPLHGGDVMLRHFKKATGYRCDWCFVALENRHATGEFTDVLRDDEVPTRLPRPRLTCQAMWPDWDC